MPEPIRSRALADTGALYALLDRDDRWHTACVAAFDRFRLPLVTSTAVLAELFHLLGDDPRAVRAGWKLVRSGALTMGAIDDSELAILEELMRKYADRPMDFADATLVHLAKRESLTTIFSIDHDDFETYRIGGKKRFRVVPERGRKMACRPCMHPTSRQRAPKNPRSPEPGAWSPLQTRPTKPFAKRSSRD